MSLKHKRMRVEKDVGNGWSRWVQPVKRGYLMSCCDCGLVHRMDFRIVKGRVQFRAQRAPMYTNRERRGHAGKRGAGWSTTQQRLVRSVKPGRRSP